MPDAELRTPEEARPPIFGSSPTEIRDRIFRCSDSGYRKGGIERIATIGECPWDSTPRDRSGYFSEMVEALGEDWFVEFAEEHHLDYRLGHCLGVVIDYAECKSPPVFEIAEPGQILDAAYDLFFGIYRYARIVSDIESRFPSYSLKDAIRDDGTRDATDEYWLIRDALDAARQVGEGEAHLNISQRSRTLQVGENRIIASRKSAARLNKGTTEELSSKYEMWMREVDKAREEADGRGTHSDHVRWAMKNIKFYSKFNRWEMAKEDTIRKKTAKMLRDGTR